MTPSPARKNVEALVLCIDRDNDLGRKASIRGPVIGEEANFKAAKALALADPEDSDTNGIFAAIKTKRESEHLYRGVEVITLTGDKDVGVKSDQKVGNQLVRVLEEYEPRGVILVTDGSEDDEILPLLQSETKILSVNTISVKAARPLESAYFKMQDFFGRVAENPQQAKMVFGIPGFLLFLIVFLSYFGIPIVEVILGIVGIYLLAKGFGYDEQLFSGLSEVKGSMLQGNIYRVFNMIAILVLVLALITGYLQVQKNLSAIYRPNTLNNPASVGDALLSQPILTANFMLFSSAGSEFAAMDMIVVAVILVAIGFMLHNFLRKEYLRIKKHVYIIMLAILVKYISTSLYWALISVFGDSTTIPVPEAFDPFQNLLIVMLISFVAVLVVHYLLKIIFFDYITRKKQLEKKYIGRGMVSKKGKKIGTVTGLVMKGNDVKGLQVKRKYYPLKSITSKGKKLMVDE
jgi:uncharacterized membrane protein